MADRESLLRAFDIGPEDLEACRAGRLGPNQARRLRRSGRADIISALAAGAALGAILLFLAHKPLVPAQWITAGLLFAAALAVGLNHARRMRDAVTDGRVETLSGAVTVRSRGRNGWWLSVAGRSFRLPVHPWQISADTGYRVYVSPRADQIVGVEPMS